MEKLKNVFSKTKTTKFNSILFNKYLYRKNLHILSIQNKMRIKSTNFLTEPNNNHLTNLRIRAGLININTLYKISDLNLRNTLNNFYLRLCKKFELSNSSNLIQKKKNLDVLAYSRILKKNRNRIRATSKALLIALLLSILSLYLYFKNLYDLEFDLRFKILSKRQLALLNETFIGKVIMSLFTPTSILEALVLLPMNLIFVSEYIIANGLIKFGLLIIPITLLTGIADLPNNLDTFSQKFVCNPQIFNISFTCMLYAASQVRYGKAKIFNIFVYAYILLGIFNFHPYDLRVPLFMLFGGYFFQKAGNIGSAMNSINKVQKLNKNKVY